MLNDDIRRVMESTEELQSMTRHSDLLRDLAKSFVPESVSRNIKLFQDLTQHFRENSPFQQLERLRLAFESTSFLPPQIQAMQKLSESLRESTGFLSPQLRTMQRLSESLRESTSFLSPQIQAMQRLSESLRTSRLFDTVHRFQTAFGGLDFRDSILKSFFPSVRGDVIPHALAALQEITKSIEQFEPDATDDVSPGDVDEATAALEAQIGLPTANAEVWFGRMIEAVNSTKDTWKKVVLCSILLPLLIQLIGVFAQAMIATPVQQAISVSVNVDAKTLVAIALETGIPQAVGDLGLVERFVQIRSGPRRTSRLLGTLMRGDIVTIVRKGRHWTLILHYDRETGTSTEGWILSRYLRPIR